MERTLALGAVFTMASPQKEDGFTPIAHELLEAFYKCKMIEYERVVIMCLWRKTYGWNKKEDWVSNTQIRDETQIALPNITRTLRNLINKKILVKNGRRVGVNKNYDEWQVEWRKLSHQITKVISPDNKKLSHQIPTKERKKLLKEISESNDSQGIKENKDMAWNRQPDDFEEGIIDLDGDGVVKAPKKAQTKKYPNAPAIRKIFQEVLGRNPLDWNRNVTVLQACENLYTERGVDKVRNALEFYKENKDKEFCPQILSPVDLDRKYAHLSSFKVKQP